MENELIRRSDAYNAVFDYVGDYEPPLLESIKDIPAVDAVEVVRCADCKYYHTEWDGTQEHYEDDYWCQWVEPNEDDYCSLGQRREEKHNALD